MAQLKQPKAVPQPTLTLPKTKDDYLKWPQTEKDLSPTPRLFRIHRVNAFEWQAFVVDGGIEYPIGKPDLFDIIKGRVAGCMRAEGQVEFLRDKMRTAEAPKLAQ